MPFIPFQSEKGELLPTNSLFGRDEGAVLLFFEQFEEDVVGESVGLGNADVGVEKEGDLVPRNGGIEGGLRAPAGKSFIHQGAVAGNRIVTSVEVDHLDAPRPSFGLHRCVDGISCKEAHLDVGGRLGRTIKGLLEVSSIAEAFGDVLLGNAGALFGGSNLWQ